MFHPLKILFITSNLGGGGAERALVNLINKLNRNKFEPHLALFQKEGEFVDKLANDVPVYEIQPQDYGSIHRTWKRIFTIRKIVRNIKPDIIMSVLWQANAVVGLTDKLWNLNTNLIFNEQNSPLSSLITDARQRKLWPIAKRLYHQADLLIATSKGIALELKSETGTSADKIKVVYNPIDIDSSKFTPKSRISKNNQDSFKILAIGRLTPQKNFSMLLKTCAIVLKTHNITLIVLGEGPERENLELLSRNLNISSRVNFLGFVPEPQVYYSQADIFALTSIHEGFGNVIVEAMSMGIPVIATDCPHGPREILQNGTSGILVPINDDNHFAREIIELIENPEKREHLSKSGLIRANDFSLQIIVPKYEEIFVNLLEK